jgi:hypothetical protein
MNRSFSVIFTRRFISFKTIAFKVTLIFTRRFLSFMTIAFKVTLEKKM